MGEDSSCHTAPAAWSDSVSPVIPVCWLTPNQPDVPGQDGPAHRCHGADGGVVVGAACVLELNATLCSSLVFYTASCVLPSLLVPKRQSRVQPGGPC